MTTDPSGPGDAPDATDSVGALAARLAVAARRSNERRLLVVTGDDDASVDRAAADALSAADICLASTTLVGDREVDTLDCERRSPDRARDLLGTTHEAIVFDAREKLSPNALGSVVGAVDGGGLLVLLTPPLADWPNRTDAFDDTLAAPPHDPEAVAGRFRRRFADSLRGRPGIAVYDADSGRTLADADRDATSPTTSESTEDRNPSVPDDAMFPDDAYRAALTRDQRDALAALERVAPNGAPAPRAAVLEADRGRGKSSAAGIAAGAVVDAGGDVVVTAPAAENAREVFARAGEFLDGRDNVDDRPAGSDDHATACEDHSANAEDDARSTPCSRDRRSAAGGRLRYRPPEDALDGETTADLLIVDEAAGLPVSRLEESLAADRIIYATTVHGYEGTGRGFTVRFRDRLEAADHAVETVTIDDPIRYAAGDPVEAWAFDALLLDARPPVTPAVEDARPETVIYRRLDRDALVDDRTTLRETFGLLARAHYRTEPDDLARLLDAPNVHVRALVMPRTGDHPPVDSDGHEDSRRPEDPGVDGHVVSVALLAREGGLSAERRQSIYAGERVRGHMIPDVLTSQLRDLEAGRPVGLRILRIATHHAVRSRGLGSRLLAAVRAEFEPGDDSARVGATDEEAVDYLGVGFGATPRLLSFWADSDYRTVHLSLTRNERSGEHSAVMLSGLTETGRSLAERHVGWFRERARSAPSGPLSDVDPDVLRWALRAAGPPQRHAPSDADAVTSSPALTEGAPDLTDREWRIVAGAAYGPGLYQVRPDPFRALSVAGLVDPRRPLTATQERLLVSLVLQAHPVDAVAESLDFHSTGECLRATGEALAVLADRYGGDVVREERSRYD